MTNVPPAPGKGGELVYPQQPPKDPILILVLNLLVAGCLGYFMIGQKMKGIVSLIAVLVLDSHLRGGITARLRGGSDRRLHAGPAASGRPSRRAVDVL